MHLPDKFLIDKDALLAQSVGDRLWRGVQAEPKEGFSDHSLRAGDAH
jgi:hypothetical protein